jgi:hypothetical protein
MHSEVLGGSEVGSGANTVSPFCAVPPPFQVSPASSTRMRITSPATCDRGKRSTGVPYRATLRAIAIGYVSRLCRSRITSAYCDRVQHDIFIAESCQVAMADFSSTLPYSNVAYSPPRNGVSRRVLPAEAVGMERRRAAVANAEQCRRVVQRLRIPNIYLQPLSYVNRCASQRRYRKGLSVQPSFIVVHEFWKLIFEDRALRDVVRIWTSRQGSQMQSA